MSVQINKIDENTYAIENLEDTQIVYELCELFNITRFVQGRTGKA